MQKIEDQIKDIHKKLGILEDYESKYGLALQLEEKHLVEIGEDIFDRKQYLSESAASSWLKMRADAINDGVQLDIVSAFRSIEKQRLIIENKLKQGQGVLNILKVSAAPGYSEHHTGRAIDITTPNCEPLIEAFEFTKAFSWLVDNASKYYFSMSYHENHSNGVAYEPWHWAYCI